MRFLKAGDKVKITIMFRGREQHRPELGFRLLQKLAEDVDELGFVESSPKQDGRNMIMVLGPHKKKAEAKADSTGRQGREAAERAAEEAEEQAERDAPTTPGDRSPRRRSAAAPRTSIPRSRPKNSSVASHHRSGTEVRERSRCRRTRRTPVPASGSG